LFFPGNSQENVMAGYSGTPLVKKLGIKPNQRIALVSAPADFDATLGDLPEGVDVQRDMRGSGKLDIIHFFVDSRAELARTFASLACRLTPAGGLWISWPKQASGVKTDLNENIVRAIGLDAGLVDNKVCAVDETWSGLRFVIRVKDRGRPRGTAKS
jgi:hypothetical protein